MIMMSLVQSSMDVILGLFFILRIFGCCQYAALSLWVKQGQGGVSASTIILLLFSLPSFHVHSEIELQRCVIRAKPRTIVKSAIGRRSTVGNAMQYAHKKHEALRTSPKQRRPKKTSGNSREIKHLGNVLGCQCWSFRE
jgi:hypothetical protein